jgi:predicted hotdog family 3-hydroxylacyl-ACP dehydratase
MNYPVSVHELSKAIPHRPPMIWLDEVLSASADGGVCAVELSPTALYARGDGYCLDFAAIEWIAEAYGYARACHFYGSGDESYGLRRAFLVGVGQLDLLQRLPARGRILVEVGTTRLMAPLVMVKGRIRDEAGTVYAEAQLKLYFEE